MNKLLLIGGGTNLLTCKEMAEDAGFYIQGILDTVHEPGTELHGLKVLGTQNQIVELCEEYGVNSVVITIGDNYIRSIIHGYLKETKPDLRYPNLIHESVVMSRYAKLGEGVVIQAGCIVNPGAIIGDHTLFLTGAHVEHDVKVGNYASISAGSLTGGKVEIGELSAITMGVTVFDRVKIGFNTVIGSGSVVTKDLPSNVLAYGNPAKIIRTRQLGERFLK